MARTLHIIGLTFLLATGLGFAQQPAPCDGFPVEGTDPVLYEQQKKLWIEQHPVEYQQMVKEQTGIVETESTSRSYAQIYATLDPNLPWVASYIEFVRNRPIPSGQIEYHTIYWNHLSEFGSERLADINSYPEKYLVLPPTLEPK